MTQLNFLLDTIDETKTSKVTYAFQQGNNNIILGFTLTENGVPIAFTDAFVDLSYDIVANVFEINEIEYTINGTNVEQGVEPDVITYPIVDGEFSIGDIDYVIDRDVVIRPAYYSLSSIAYVSSYNKIDFKSNIVQCSTNPTAVFTQIDESDLYTCKIMVDTSSQTEVLSNYYKNSIALKIEMVNGSNSEFFTFTTPFFYNVLKSSAYLISSLPVENNES